MDRSGEIELFEGWSRSDRRQVAQPLHVLEVDAPQIFENREGRELRYFWQGLQVEELKCPALCQECKLLELLDLPNLQVFEIFHLSKRREFSSASQLEVERPESRQLRYPD